MYQCCCIQVHSLLAKKYGDDDITDTTIASAISGKQRSKVLTREAPFFLLPITSPHSFTYRPHDCHCRCHFIAIAIAIADLPSIPGYGSPLDALFEGLLGLPPFQPPSSLVVLFPLFLLFFFFFFFVFFTEVTHPVTE